jgi:acetyltransferase-like isoleucine patch superfamily enzyme
LPITIIDNGTSNEVSIPEPIMAEQSATIIFDGNGNRVSLGENTILQGTRLRLVSDCSFESGINVRLASIEVFAFLRGHVRIGTQTGFTWHTQFDLHEPGEIVIGEGCLFASGTALTVSDMHSIIDIETGLRINPAKSISIGDRVWLSGGVRVMKGADVGSGSIVGYGSTITGRIPENSLAVGTPAKVVRTGVTWRYDLRNLCVA